MRPRLYIASNNPHKQKELQRILTAFEIRLPAVDGYSFSYAETGESFLENAYGKAGALYALVKQPVLADDSGLCIDCLEGGPGIYSARFGSGDRGKPLNDHERNRYLLARLRGCTDRSAFFVCCMVLMLDDSRFFTAQETLHGEISSSPRGKGGFGYDPLFYLPEYKCTVAQLSAEQKDALSHRGKAARVIAAVLQHLISKRFP
jgi:XTP/dITP diphosphohydrolase